jgi:hypothetical protein
MATTSNVLAIVGVGLLLRACSPAVVHLLPTDWTHTIAPASCIWSVAPWAERLGGYASPRRTPKTDGQWLACMHRRGMKSQLHVLNTILARWPSRAELAALSRQDTPEDENRSPLSAQRPPGAGVVLSGRGG